jgi:acyl dehydratase
MVVEDNFRLSYGSWKTIPHLSWSIPPAGADGSASPRDCKKIKRCLASTIRRYYNIPVGSLFAISAQSLTVRSSGEITMEISTRFVGTRLKDYKAEITWRHTMNYAAAIDDDNPCYFDDEREGGIIAPPMFNVAVTWPIVERIWEYIEADDFPIELLATQVHYTEHLEFHRPLKPEGTVTVKGEIAAILPHRAGTHVIIRFDALDDEGLPLFTEHIGAMMRGVKCVDDGARKEEALPEVPLFEGEKTLWEVPLHLDPLRSFVYDGCSDIVFPIHTSKRFAHQVGLPGIIIQGTATLAFAVRELINREAAMNPLRLQSLSCRFAGMVLPGTDITVQLEGKDEKEDGTGLFFSVINQEGKRAISGGYALVSKG